MFFFTIRHYFQFKCYFCCLKRYAILVRVNLWICEEILIKFKGHLHIHQKHVKPNSNDCLRPLLKWVDFSRVSVLYLSVVEVKHATLMRGKGAARDRSNEDQREGEGVEDDRDSIRVEYSCICPVHYGRPRLINKSNSRLRALSCSPMHNAFI